MTRAAGEAFADLRPGKRTLLYSRSSIIGSHRYGGIWLGDNHSSWEQLLANIQMMPSVQMCGFLYTGADLCGFAGDTTPDLALRWLEFGLFTPLMRNHAAGGTRPQEYYRFADQLPAIRSMLRLRYALLPYLYSTFMQAALEGTSYFRPLGFDFPADPDAREVQDQLLLGDGVVNQTIPLILCGEEDVEGNHGATIGRLDEKMLFYLASRGIPEEAARSLLARARIEAVVDLLPEALAEEAHKFMEAHTDGL